MNVTVSLPAGRSYWSQNLTPLVDQLRDRGVQVKVETHPVVNVPDQPFTHGDDLPYVALWAPGHAPGRPTKDGVGLTGQRLLEELLNGQRT